MAVFPDIMVSEIYLFIIVLNTPHANLFLYCSMSSIVQIQSVDEPMSARTVIFHHVSLPLECLCAHGCNGEPHFLRVMLEITRYCYFYTDLYVELLVNSVVRSFLACLCAFGSLVNPLDIIRWPFVSVPHALFLQPQQVRLMK